MLENDKPNEPSSGGDDTLLRRLEAEEYCAVGQARYEVGNIDDAEAYYEMAIALYPTAESCTYLGITFAARGRWDEAIEQCRHAIELDPALGNPYNDIGVYLIEQDRLEDALPYLEKAIAAPTYDCRNYPHYHRGRILERQCRFTEARDAYKAAFEIAPDWNPARVALHRVLGWLN
jgi:tetratricopeptide (TPR) repeat protein